MKNYGNFVKEKYSISTLDSSDSLVTAHWFRNTSSRPQKGKIMGYILSLLPLLLLFGMSVPVEVDENMKKFAQVSNNLGVNLYRKLSPEGANIFFSPFSISVSLAMLMYGTRGETTEEMKKALSFEEIGLTDENVFSTLKSLINIYSQSSDHYQLYVANALMANEKFPIDEKYKNDIADIFQALVTDADFADSANVIEQVNEWVSTMTNNQITKLLESLDPNTVLIILNAVYFKGTWLTQFQPEFTSRAFFFNLGVTSKKVKVPMMHLTEKLRYARLGDVTVLELPYNGNEISMFILISEYISGLPELEKELDLNMLRHIRRLMRKTEVTLLLPKFSLSYKRVLNDALKAIGIKSIFNNGANLTGISEFGELVVSTVLHKAAIDVNEEGTEASGSTAVLVQTRTIGSQIYVRADHPFLFAIVDIRNDLVLFQGRVSEL